MCLTLCPRPSFLVLPTACCCISGVRGPLLRRDPQPEDEELGCDQLDLLEGTHAQARGWCDALHVVGCAPYFPLPLEAAPPPPACQGQVERMQTADERLAYSPTAPDAQSVSLSPPLRDGQRTDPENKARVAMTIRTGTVNRPWPGLGHVAVMSLCLCTHS